MELECLYAVATVMRGDAVYVSPVSLTNDLYQKLMIQVQKVYQIQCLGCLSPSAVFSSADRF